jgi:uncharacterized membrane protein
MNRSLASMAMFVAALLSAPFASAAPPSYRLTEFGFNDPPGSTTYISGLADTGEVALTVYGSTTVQSYLWFNGVTTRFSGADTACGPNANVLIAGFSRLGHISLNVYNADGSCNKNAVWVQGKLTYIGAPPAPYTTVGVGAINDRDQVIGSLFSQTIVNGNSLESQFVWQNGQYTLLPPLPNGEMYYPGGATALSINDLGVISGNSGTAGGFRGVVWINDQPIDMGTCPGFPESSGGIINNLGMVTGACESLQQTYTPIVWQFGHFNILPLPASGYQSGLAGGINDFGEIAGVQYAAPGSTSPSTALLWLQGTVYNLNTLIAPDDPLKPYVTLVYGGAVNALGQVTASGVDSRLPAGSTVQLLLTPTH